MQRYKSPVNGYRYYYIEDQDTLVPGVTSIIDGTSDKSWLKKWREKIGPAKADKITRDAAQRGTVMHLMYETYFQIYYREHKKIKKPLKETFNRVKQHPEVKQIPLSLKKLGADLFLQFQREKLTNQFKDFFLSEGVLWTTRNGGYSGTVDMVAKDWEDNLIIIDFKTAKRPKKQSELEDYKLQLGAYTIGLFDRYGQAPKRCELWISNEQVEFPDIVRLSNEEIKHYSKKFLERVETFHENYKDHGIDLKRDKEE